MVSNLTSVFRNRNQQDKKDKKDKKSAVSTSSSSEEQPQSTPPVAMVLVPTVTIQEVTKEVEIKLEEAEPIPSSSVQIQEIEVLTPNEDEVKTETEEPCALCTKVGSYIRPYYESLKIKTQKLVDRVMDPSLHATIKSEFFEYLPYVLLAFAIFFFAITFVSFVKLLSHGVHNEPSFFCRYFSGPFSPMFDALCAPEPFVFSDELPRVMSGLIDEIMLTIAEFFRTIGKGFTVFGTLFTAIYHGLSENVFFGFHELGENLGENINHLIHFIVQFFHQIIHLFFSAIATVAGAIAGIFTSLHDYFEPKPVVW
ncbi:hypothetical protein CAEBREN_04972 [Caenorhabditis brenneri]|uniref:Uncharacterized protein n=1 Tax=Caenorhabditis brenneri TaxID=135651 RepID=G0MK26_CAEBE|nr:hypothetical protein CAEBREN_04972 [Caenorhabditis brenneri]